MPLQRDTDSNAYAHAASSYANTNGYTANANSYGYTNIDPECNSTASAESRA